MESQNSIIKSRNSLNMIRILAAFKVLYGHYRVHMNLVLPDWLTLLIEFIPGVPVFFFMSGFLIWNSVGRSRTYKEYLSKRFWRIYPELWLGVAVEIIVVAIFLWDSIPYGDLLMFTVTQSTILQFWTPDSLRGFGCGTPNGALWTICVLIQFYIIIWFIYRFYKNKKKGTWIIGILLTAAASVLMHSFSYKVPTIIYKLVVQTVVPYLWLFLLGAFIAEFAETILPVIKKYWAVPIIISIAVYLVNIDIRAVQGYGLIRCVSVGIGLLGFAYQYPQLNVKKDISYGLYIYHMIVCNVMIELGLTGNVRYMLIGMIISILAAEASTFFSKEIMKWRRNQVRI